MRSNSDKTIVICLVSKYQAGQLKAIVKEVDPAAFVYSTKVSEVMGEWNKVSNVSNKEG
jgi:uncharacterized membrane-anchored protein YitT (DUF2179 family)